MKKCYFIATVKYKDNGEIRKTSYSSWRYMEDLLLRSDITILDVEVFYENK